MTAHIYRQYGLWWCWGKEYRDGQTIRYCANGHTAKAAYDYMMQTRESRK